MKLTARLILLLLLLQPISLLAAPSPALSPAPSTSPLAPLTVGAQTFTFGPLPSLTLTMLRGPGIASPPLFRAVITAAGCNTAQVQAAFNLATSTGDEVSVPAGTCVWTSGASWSAPANAKFYGAGPTTIINDNINRTGADFALLDLIPNVSGTFTMSDMSFGNGGGTASSNGVIRFFGQSTGLRIHHVQTVNLGNFTFLIDGPYGVADHNTITLSGVQVAFRIQQTSLGGVGGFGDNAWAQPTGLGTANFFYIETNDFSSTDGFGVIDDAYLGGRWVIRFNTSLNAGIQTHPTGGSGRARGSRAWEAYKNVVTSNKTNFNFGFISNGTGVIWGNTVQANGFSNFVTLHSVRSSGNPYGCTAPPGGWGCAGTQSPAGVISNWDQNTSTVTGFRPLDQPGNGPGDLLANAFPNATNTATGCIYNQSCAWPRQPQEPVKEWLNPWSCAGCGGNFWAVYEPSVLIANNTYYLFTPSFNGTSGVGSGILAARPVCTSSTCTTGVSYWATDQGNWNQSGSGGQGVLYTWNGTAWVLDYTPYTYPHPLTNTGSSLTSITPSSGTQGTAVLSVALVGSGTTWANGVTALSFSGSGITVNSTTVTSSTAATASIAISALAATGARNVTMTTGATTETLTNGFTVNALTPVPTKLGFTVQPPTTIATGVTFPTPPVVAVQFSDGTTDTTSTASVTLTLCNGTGTLNGTLTRAAISGLATFTGLNVSTVVGGTAYRICAAATSLTSATSNNFTVTVPVDTPTRLGFNVQPPTSVASGAVISPSPKVAVQFTSGVTDITSTASVVIGLCPGSPAATLGGTLTRAAISGIATFDDITVTVTGNGSSVGFTFCASSAGLTSATSTAFDVVGAGVCQSSPLTVKNIKWPTGNTGSRALGWNSAGFSIATVQFLYPGTVLFTDTRGCQATYTK